MRPARRLFLAGLVAFAVASPAAAQGRVFVNHDEWTINTTGRVQAGAANVTTFVRNTAQWLTGSTTGSALIVGASFAFPQADLFGDLSTGGFSYSVDPFSAGNWANRASYSMLFVDVNNAPAIGASFQSDLINYVLGGGSVYFALGTGVGGAAGEAAAANTFLGHFGIQAAPNYNGISTTYNTSSYSSQSPYGSALFSGVSQLYAANGNPLSAGGPNTANYGVQLFGGDLFAAAAPRVAVPEPATAGLLLVAGIAMLGAARRRRS